MRADMRGVRKEGMRLTLSFEMEELFYSTRTSNVEMRSPRLASHRFWTRMLGAKTTYSPCDLSAAYLPRQPIKSISSTTAPQTLRRLPLPLRTTSPSSVYPPARPSRQHPHAPEIPTSWAGHRALAVCLLLKCTMFHTLTSRALVQHALPGPCWLRGMQKGRRG